MADALQVARENIAAMNASDAERLRATYADGAVLETPDQGRLEGGDQATAYAMLWVRAFPDARQTIVKELASGDWVVQEFTVAGTHTETLAAPDGEVPATNRRVTTRGVQVLRVQGGRIVEEHVYFDELQLLGQLGLLPEPAAV
jgi:steroid delta-isomerase-like uncharacterized protein